MYVGSGYIKNEENDTWVFTNNLFVEASGGGFGINDEGVIRTVYAEFKDHAINKTLENGDRVPGINWYRVSDPKSKDNDIIRRDAACEWAKKRADENCEEQRWIYNHKKAYFDPDGKKHHQRSFYCSEIVWCAYLQCNNISLGGNLEAIPLNIDWEDKGSFNPDEWFRDYPQGPAVKAQDIIDTNFRENKYTSHEGEDYGIYIDLDGNYQD
jgi:hypothetical protein